MNSRYITDRMLKLLNGRRCIIIFTEKHNVRNYGVLVYCNTTETILWKDTISSKNLPSGFPTERPTGVLLGNVAYRKQDIKEIVFDSGAIFYAPDDLKKIDNTPSISLCKVLQEIRDHGHNSQSLLEMYVFPATDCELDYNGNLFTRPTCDRTISNIYWDDEYEIQLPCRHYFDKHIDSTLKSHHLALHIGEKEIMKQPTIMVLQPEDDWPLPTTCKQIEKTLEFFESKGVIKPGPSTSTVNSKIDRVQLHELLKQKITVMSPRGIPITIDRYRSK